MARHQPPHKNQRKRRRRRDQRHPVNCRVIPFISHAISPRNQPLSRFHKPTQPHRDARDKMPRINPLSATPGQSHPPVFPSPGTPGEDRGRGWTRLGATGRNSGQRPSPISPRVAAVLDFGEPCRTARRISSPTPQGRTERHRGSHVSSRRYRLLHSSNRLFSSPKP
jgi:hypothetical protein